MCLMNKWRERRLLLILILILKWAIRVMLPLRQPMSRKSLSMIKRNTILCRLIIIRQHRLVTWSKMVKSYPSFLLMNWLSWMSMSKQCLKMQLLLRQNLLPHQKVRINKLSSVELSRCPHMSILKRPFAAKFQRPEMC